jgi:hypothetical protein
MSLTNRGVVTLCVSAIVLLEVFQLAVGSVALFVFGGRTAGLEKVMLFVPFLSLAVLFLALRRVRLATWLMWLLFGLFHAWAVRISWPKWGAVYMMLKLDWPLLGICILLTVIAARKRTAVARYSNAGI